MPDSYDYRERKIVAVLSNRLDCGVALNVLGHLTLSIGRFADDQILGRPQLVDGSGIVHRGISKYPVIVTQVKPGTVRKTIEQARLRPELLVADYPRQMLDTGHDDELARALTAAPEASLEYLGAVIYGPSEAVDAITRKYSLWRGPASDVHSQS